MARWWWHSVTSWKIQSCSHSKGKLSTYTLSHTFIYVLLNVNRNGTISLLAPFCATIFALKGVSSWPIQMAVDWRPNVCANFLLTFLNFLKSNIRTDALDKVKFIAVIYVECSIIPILFACRNYMYMYTMHYKHSYNAIVMNVIKCMLHFWILNIFMIRSWWVYVKPIIMYNFLILSLYMRIIFITDFFYRSVQRNSKWGGEGEYW